VGGVGGVEADVGDVAVDFGEVHAVADDELVGDLEADVVGLDGDEAATGFVEAGGDLEGGGLVLEHEAAEIAKGEAGVEDVFDQDDVVAFDGVVDVLDELDGAGGDAGATVAGDGDEVECVVDGDGAGEIGEEDGRSLEHADEHDGLAGLLVLVVGCDLAAHSCDALGDLRGGEEDAHSRGGWKDGGSGGRQGTGGHRDRVAYARCDGRVRRFPQGQVCLINQLSCVSLIASQSRKRSL